MVETIIKSAIGFIVSGALGYCISAIKVYRGKLKQEQVRNKAIEEALMILLQTNLTTTYYIYEPNSKIPDYVYRNWLSSLKIYEKLGGDDYIHTLATKMKDWDFTKTDILN